jgi:hypothetical protein|nr:MAG TPA: hypothetical protein [Caudoviricetes sp.]
MIDLNRYPETMAAISDIANLHQKIANAAIEFGIINRGIIAYENDCIKVCEYENADEIFKVYASKRNPKGPHIKCIYDKNNDTFYIGIKIHIPGGVIRRDNFREKGFVQ